MEEIVVGVADCRVASVPGQVLATYALGSCIGLAVHDAHSGVGGLIHFMLPDSSIDSQKGKANPYMFADTGIPRLLEEVCVKGASKRHLAAHAIGAAQILDPKNLFEIGKRNYQAMRRILWKAGVLLQAEEVGGAKSRTMRLEIGTGRVWLQESGETRELSRGSSRKGGSVWPTAF